MNEENAYKAEAFDVVQLILSKHHDHQMHGVIKLNGHIDYEILKKAVMESARDLPHIFCKFEKKGYKEYWIRGNFTDEDIVKIKESDLSQKQIMQVVTKATDTFIGPQLCITILRGASKDVLSIVMNHMLCDGSAFKSYIYLVCSLYNNIITNNSNSLRYKSDVRGLDALIYSIKGKLNYKNIKVKNDNNLIELEGNIKRPFIALEKISREQFMVIKDFAKRKKVTINDVFMSAYIFELKKTFGLSISNMTGTVDLRKYLKDKKSEGLCNLSSFITCNIDSEQDLSFDNILTQVSESMKEQKESTNCLKSVILLNRAQKYLPYNMFKRIISKGLKNPPIAFTNIGILEKQLLEFQGLKVTEAFITGAIKYVPNFQMAVSTFDNEVTLSINLYGSEKDEEKINLFLKNLKKSLLSNTLIKSDLSSCNNEKK